MGLSSRIWLHLNGQVVLIQAAVSEGVEGWARSPEMSMVLQRAVAWSTVRCIDTSTSVQEKVCAAIYTFPDLLV